MGNESSKSKENRSSNNRTTDGASSNAVQRLQKAIPAVIKSGTSGGPSSSQLQRHLEQARKSKTLKLKGAGIKAIPPIIVELTDELRTVDISENKLRELPPFLGQFSMLRQLHIQDNRLTWLPDELGCLKKLELLNTAGNQLETVLYLFLKQN